ncbi:MAG: multicopper oxidase domain-containing protein [Acidimicrobiia bacterium]|nr:multicopper oxidase domain-containing protein [Acidimicrobiia bacterium]
MKLTRDDRQTFGLGAWLFALLAVLLAFSALWVAGDARSSSSDAEKAAALGGGTQVSLREFVIDPAMIHADANGTLAIKNTGSAPHNFAIKGTKLATPNIDPGGAATLSLEGLKAGTYEAICEIPGHAGQGMKATLMIGAGGGGTTAAASGSTGQTDAALRADNARMDALMKKGTQAYVDQLTKGPNTKGVGNQPLAPKVLADGTKEFDITAKVIDWQVDQTKTVRAWAYGPTGGDDSTFGVPGPLLKVNTGDRVKFVLTNDLPQSTIVHFHGMELPNAMDGVPDVTQDPVLPGKTFTYEFVAEKSQVNMYHSHHHGEHQVPDGLAGVLLVGDLPLPDGRGPVTQEIPMALNDAGVIGLSLNGKSFPATAPIIANVGETVLIHYFNEGLSIHPMHLHGLVQTVIAKDGIPITPYDVDTLNVAPGERYSVIITPRADQVGVWAYHCHILTHAERDDGMFGMVTTFVVKE